MEALAQALLMKSDDFREFYAAWSEEGACVDRPVIVNPPDLPEPVGFAHAVVAGGTIHLGGQIGEGATLVEQFDSAVGRIVSAMRGAGAEPDDLSLVVYTTAIDEYRGLDVGARRGLAPPLRQALPGDGADRRLGADGAGGQGRADGRRGAAGWLTFSNGRGLGHERFAAIAEEGEPGRLNRQLVKALGDEGPARARLPGSAQELCQLREGSPTAAPRRRRRSLQGLGGYPILRAAKPELRDHWIPRLSAGDVVAAFALSEPQAGSDAAALLRAETDGDGFRLTGTKLWISNAPEADVYSVFARTSDDGAKGITAFAVPRETEGLTGEHLELVAPHPIGRLDFDGVPAGPEQVLGEVGGGFAVAMDTLDLFRPSVGAFGVGMAQAALDAAVRHTSEREAFGKPLARFQAVGHQLAEVATQIQAARLLVSDAASQYDAGVRPVRKASAMAKLFATETAQRAVDVAIQVHGARPSRRAPARTPLPRGARAADLRRRVRGAARDHCPRAVQELE